MSTLARKFCKAPFQKFETLIDGKVAPCCSIWTDLRLGDLDTQTMQEIWNGESAQEMRRSILDGSFRHCKQDRCSMIIHDQLPDRDSITEPALRQAIDENKVVMDDPPSWLFIAHDVTCNLACPSCRSSVMAADEAQEARFDRIEREVLSPMFQPGHPIEISISGQGDPWSSKHYKSLLRRLAENPIDAKLNIHTNAMLLTEARWQQYIGLERYTPLIDISIDACSPWTYANLRRPGDWDKLLVNLRFIADKRRAGVFRAFYLNATVQLGNFHELGPMVDLAQGLGCEGMRMYLIQKTGEHIEGDFARKSVADPKHPLHVALLETLRDPRLASPIAQLYDVDVLRVQALSGTLPSDSLAGADADAFAQAIDAAISTGELERANALAASARWRFPADLGLRVLEGIALQAAGFAEEASYRYREILAHVPDVADVQVRLATALAEAGHLQDSVDLLESVSANTEDDRLRVEVGAYLTTLRQMLPRRSFTIHPA